MLCSTCANFSYGCRDYNHSLLQLRQRHFLLRCPPAPEVVDGELEEINDGLAGAFDLEAELAAVMEFGDT